MNFAAILIISLSASLLSGCDAFPGNKPALLGHGDNAYVIAKTNSGPIEGRESADGQAFLGIPYAAAPIGNLRWRAPQPEVIWTKTRPALKTGSPCMQAIGSKAVTGGGGGLVMGSEDCLFLNIYTPPIAREPESGWPVVVYIPGGAFTLGAGDNYDPSPLVISQRIIVVTINYRLGAFGFLAHPRFVAESPEGGSGNFALMDQQAALRWVRDNIRAVGGNSENVTLMGESAGAWSACYHLVSPASAGLFKRAILQSGSCTEKMSLAQASEADAAGLAYAIQAGCADKVISLEATCLRSLPAVQIARLPSTRRGINGAGSWSPVWGEALIPLKPSRAFDEGRWNQVPTIVGSNRAEGRLFALGVRDEATYVARIRQEYGADADAVLARYPVSAHEKSAMNSYAAVMTDSRFSCPAEELRQALSVRAPVYGYEFTDPDPPVLLPRFLTGGEMGAYHASELGFVFGSSWALEDVEKFNLQQRQLSARMMDMWGAFARDGTPSSNWKPINEENKSLLQLTSDAANASNVEDFTQKHLCDFWQKLQIN